MNIRNVVPSTGSMVAAAALPALPCSHLDQVDQAHVRGPVDDRREIKMIEMKKEIEHRRALLAAHGTRPSDRR